MITRQLFNRIFPTAGLTSEKNLRKYNLVRCRDELIAALNEFLPKYKINTWRRVCAFLSCCGYETDYFKTTSEYASGADYEGRKNLGNIHPGDGKAFKGSGAIQTTGRYNFMRIVIRYIKHLSGKDYSYVNEVKGPGYDKVVAEANRLDCNFLEHPERLRDNIRIAVEAACIFWEENGLNEFADAGRIKQLNGLVNRGSAAKTALGSADRIALNEKCLKVIPTNFRFDAEVENADPAYTQVEAPKEITLVPAESTTGVPVTTEPRTIDLDRAQNGYDKASAAMQNPAVRGVAVKAGSKAALSLAGIWGTTGGKVAIILTAVAILGIAGTVAWSYRHQIKLGYEIVRDTIKKALGGAVTT